MQNSEEYNNKGGVKNKKISAEGPSSVEVRPHHMCLASYFARVLAAERRKDEKCTLDQLFLVLPGPPVGTELWTDLVVHITSESLPIFLST